MSAQCSIGITFHFETAAAVRVLPRRRGDLIFWATSVGPPSSLITILAFMDAINSQLSLTVNSELTNCDYVAGTLRAMAQRELKIPPAEARLMGMRLKETLDIRNRKQNWLAEQMGLAPEMVSRMINEGAGSLAGWRKACQILDASMDYVVKLTYQKADPEFTNLIRANGEMAKEVERLKTERDRLLDQVTKLQMISR